MSFTHLEPIIIRVYGFEELTLSYSSRIQKAIVYDSTVSETVALFFNNFKIFPSTPMGSKLTHSAMFSSVKYFQRSLGSKYIVHFTSHISICPTSNSKYPEITNRSDQLS